MSFIHNVGCWSACQFVPRLMLVAVVIVLSSLTNSLEAQPKKNASVDPKSSAKQDNKPATPAVRDPFKDQYADYVPPFIQQIERLSGVLQSHFRGFKRDEEEMRLSSEPTFYTQNVLNEDSRANALIDAGLKKESEKQFREALKIYQQVIDKFPTVLYRVSRHGVFVPAAQYCQRRILGFPAEDLAFYRTLYDPQAKEAFEQARRQFSLLGLSDIVTQMLATSYGGPALIELGNASLDAGYYLAALEAFTTVRDYFPDKQLQTPELSLKIAYCEKLLGSSPASVSKNTGDKQSGKSSLSADQLASFSKAVDQAKARRTPFHSQAASDPHTTSDDYTLMPATTDPLAIQPPTWEQPLPGSRHDFFVYTQPVVTEDSVVYRHKNLIYCRSLLNGEQRWSYEVGGRASWQNWLERMYPQDDLLVQDGLVFTTVSKVGPSLVALDQVTGQVRWSFGPIAASNEEEARMRFEAAPTSGPRTIYAGYVLDNIEGETHTDTEYGVIAFDSKSGRVNWRATLCRLNPGKFAGGYAETRRNRIRSFSSPPLFHEGTVYYNTNAGAIAAMDALSGQVKWLMRYPYYPEIHDATRVFGRGGEPVQYTRVNFRPHTPMLWYNHRPLMLDERLIVATVDSPMLMSLDRRTGQVHWTVEKANNAAAYLLGTTRAGEIAVAYTGRDKTIDATRSVPPLFLLDPTNGQTVWKAPDVVKLDDQPVMKHYVFASPTLHFHMNDEWFEMAARPTMTQDDKVFLPSFRYLGYPIYGYVSNLGVLDLAKRTVIDQRRFYSGEILSRADTDITVNGPDELKAFEESPQKDDKIRARIAMLKEVIADSVPVNEHGPFLPFSRITCERFGAPFELRITPRSIAMVYDQAAVAKTIASRNDPVADFAKAELAMADSRLNEAANLLQRCLSTISSEDLDFRAAIHQQLYRVFQGMAQRAIRAARADDYLQAAIGMNRTASSLAEEIESLFAVAEAYEGKKDYVAAGNALATIIATHGEREMPISPLAFQDSSATMRVAEGVFDQYRSLVGKSLFSAEMTESLQLAKKGLMLYQSVLSPASKNLTVRAGELAAHRLSILRARSPEFARQWEERATEQLKERPTEELFAKLPEFPGTNAAQQVVEQLLASAAEKPSAASRQQSWQLNDLARFSGLKIPTKFQLSETGAAVHVPLKMEPMPRELDFPETEGASRLILQRRDDLKIAPQLLFVGAQLRKKLDNKFSVTAIHLDSGETAWDTGELRLKGKGQEPGFFAAFVVRDVVVVHGLYDVLALSLTDGKVKWRYQVPFDFEIRHAVLAGDLLVLSGETESLALYTLTDSDVGEVAWQVKEFGDLYIPPYTHGDRVVSVRKLPFNITVRHRATGRLIGRMDLPDLSQNKTHPLIENGSAELPVAHHEQRLLVTDGWYYILIDTEKLAVIWKRLIDANDTKREPALRFSLNEKYITVLKEDFDMKAMYLLSVESGDVLWKSDPKDAKAPLPSHSSLLVGDRLYTIQPHAGQGFYFVGRESPTGKLLYRQEVTGYRAKPIVRLHPAIYGKHAIVEISDGQDFELRAFDVNTGKLANTLAIQGVGPFGVHGHMSNTVQNGHAILMSKNKLRGN